MCLHNGVHPFSIMIMIMTIQTHSEHPMTLSVFQPLEVVVQFAQLAIMDIKSSLKLTQCTHCTTLCLILVCYS